ncbi:MAG: ABC transporter ATP-binding protein [Actinomycetales bacterium]|nr:MAG: ABC transporter ATP-binding protein [Actinomycetales bacterium]
MSTITLSALNIEKEKNEILHSISLEFPEGKIIGLLGPSGSGKTTILRSIVGLQRITSGSISVLNQPAGSKALRSQIAYSTQSASVYGDLTCTENIRFFASLFKENELSVTEILELVQLTKNRKQLAQTLSGGERSRLALATALVGNPKIIILDEPTVGLDPVLREELWGLFRRLCEKGKTLVVSSHVMEEAENCDHLILLRDGKILAEGTVSELKKITGKSDMDSVFITLVRGK